MKRIPAFTTALMVAGVAALTAQAAPPDTVDTLTAAPEASAEADATDDILLVIDLPLVAEELREDGVEDAEVEQALVAAEDAGAPAGDATEMLDGEAEAVKNRGVKKGFAVWARRHIAKGHHGVVLRQLAKERAEEADLTDEEKEALKAALAEVREANGKRKKALEEKRDALKKAGKAMKLRGKAKHEKWRKHAAKKHLEHLEELKAGGLEDPRLDKAIAKAERELAKARKEHKGAREDAKDAREDAEEAREDAKEAREDAEDAREDAKDAREDARDEAKDAREAAKDAREAAKDAREAGDREAHKDAMKAHKDAMKEHKAAMDALEQAGGNKRKGKGGKKGGGQ